MNVADARNLIAAYARSQFFDRSASGWFEDHEDAKRAGTVGRTIGARAVGGSTVPIARGEGLQAAMLANVAEAENDVAATKDRLERARLDGLFDADAFQGLPKEIRAEWIAACATIRGDAVRAAAELKHWHEYLAWSRSSRAVTLTPSSAGHRRSRGADGLVAALANAKSFEPDRRLPREPGDDDDVEAPL